MDNRFLSTDRKDKIEQRMARIDTVARLFMVSWLFVIFQGAIRKWLFPGFAFLYFVQDVPIFIAYIYAIGSGIIWFGGVFYFSLILSFMLFFQTTLQIIFINYDLPSALMGLHHYLFYLPMIFLIPACMTRKNIRKFLRFNLLTIIPMSLLAFVQIVSPRGAWINQTAAGDDVGHAFGVTTDLARSSGTFNFTLPFSVWCGIMAALVIGEWLTPREQRSFQSRIFLVFNTIAILFTTATGGSRTAVFLVLLSFIGGFLTVLIRKNFSMFFGYTGLLMLIPLFIALSYLFVPANLEALTNRFTEKKDQTEMTSRVRTMTIGFITDTEFDLMGHGIADYIPAAENASKILDPNPFRGMSYLYVLEWDNLRAVEGLGTVVGSFVVLCRYVASILVLFAAYKATTLPALQRFNHAIPLAFTIVPTMAIGDMVHSAPIQAPQILYCAAIICSALLYRREVYASSPMPLMESTARV